MTSRFAQFLLISPYHTYRWVKPWYFNHPICLRSLLKRCGQMNNVKSVNTSAPSARDSFCTWPLWSCSTWKVVRSGNWQPKKLRLCSPQLIQISIPSPWHRMRSILSSDQQGTHFRPGWGGWGGNNPPLKKRVIREGVWSSATLCGQCALHTPLC